MACNLHAQSTVITYVIDDETDGGAGYNIAVSIDELMGVTITARHRGDSVYIPEHLLFVFAGVLSKLARLENRDTARSIADLQQKLKGAM